MSETVSAKITQSVVGKSGTFDDGKAYTVYTVTLAADDGGETRSGEFWAVGDAKPPTEGETGSFIVEPKAKGNGFKIRRAPRSQGGGGRGTGPRPEYGWKTPPEDALRMSRSTGLTAAATVASACGLDSTQKVLDIAKQFADFIYNGPKEES